MTCLSSLWNFRYPGGFLALGFFSSSALSFRLGSAITITLSPAHRSSACQRWSRAPFGAALRRLLVGTESSALRREIADSGAELFKVVLKGTYTDFASRAQKPPNGSRGATIDSGRMVLIIKRYAANRTAALLGLVDRIVRVGGESGTTESCGGTKTWLTPRTPPASLVTAKVPTEI